MNPLTLPSPLWVEGKDYVACMLKQLLIGNGVFPEAGVESFAVDGARTWRDHPGPVGPVAAIKHLAFFRKLNGTGAINHVKSFVCLAAVRSSAAFFAYELWNERNPASVDISHKPGGTFAFKAV